MLGKILDRYCRFIDVLIAVDLAVMVVLVFGNVVMRYGFNSGITTSEELSRWLFVWLTFLGAITAMREGTHLGSDTLVAMLSTTGKKVFLVIGHVLMLFVCWLLFRGAYDQMLVNWDTTSAVMEVSMAWFYGSGLVLAVSGALILIERLWRLATGRLSDAELIGVRESEEEPVDVPAPLK